MAFCQFFLPCAAQTPRNSEGKERRAGHDAPHDGVFLLGGCQVRHASHGDHRLLLACHAFQVSTAPSTPCASTSPFLRSCSKLAGLCHKVSLNDTVEVDLAEKETEEDVLTANGASDSLPQSGGDLPDEFASLEHPIQPLETDGPIRCPQPEPCIIHDGRMWKQRLQLSSRRGTQLPFLTHTEVLEMHQKQGVPSNECGISSSVSAPVASLTKLLNM